MTVQLALFSPDAEAQRRLREAYEALAAYHETLLAEHIALQQAHRTLEQERDKWFNAFQALQRLQAATDQRVDLLRLRRELAAAEEHIQFLSGLLHGRPGSTTTTLEPLLKKILTIAHPDRWSQGQLASELAHEVSVHINALRDEVQP